MLHVIIGMKIGKPEVMTQMLVTTVTSYHPYPASVYDLGCI